MKKIMLMVMVIGCVLVGTVSQGAAWELKPLTIEISNCLCSGKGEAFKYGCKLYTGYRLQLNKTPETAVSKATNRCEGQFGPTKPDNNAKCKEGINFLRNKE